MDMRSRPPSSSSWSRVRRLTSFSLVGSHFPFNECATVCPRYCLHEPNTRLRNSSAFSFPITTVMKWRREREREARRQPTPSSGPRYRRRLQLFWSSSRKLRSPIPPPWLPPSSIDFSSSPSFFVNMHVNMRAYWPSTTSLSYTNSPNKRKTEPCLSEGRIRLTTEEISEAAQSWRC